MCIRDSRAIDAAIAGNVAGLPEFAEADGVFTYLSFGAEVDTRILIECAWTVGKAVALPRVVPGTRQMRWYAVDSLDCLERSSFGVEEPPADPAREVTPRDFHTPVALVPGLAFDREEMCIRDRPSPVPTISRIWYRQSAGLVPWVR